MEFRTFDILFVVVLALGIAAAALSPYLEEPYPVVIMTAFAVGAVAFLYLTVRIKFGGIMKTVDQRLGEEEAAFATHRERTAKTFTEMETATKGLREAVQTAGERSGRDVDGLRKSVADFTGQLNQQVEALASSVREVKQTHASGLAAFQDRLAAFERARQETDAVVSTLTSDFNAFVADEQHFRDVIQGRIADRVSYLEDFIREKRKSLQI